LNNCSSDDHCGACPDRQTRCLLSENRCVACDRETGEGCAQGEECSPFGKCVPTGTTCPVDGHGTPTITCAADADCSACDPLHQVCDPAAKRCVACTPDNTRSCQSTDSCIDGKCVADCPQSCDTDAACSNCGIEGKKAPACLGHKCAECSPTMPCPQGKQCTPQGRCILACGKENKGVCDTDSDCVGCQQAPKCQKPINGGEGKCIPNATGCSELGQSVAVLPEPFDQVTNLCSTDNDCKNVGVTLNVGKMLRELTNFDGIDDANITYGMNKCASLDIVNNISCGMCVPCKVDSDCKPIDIDSVAMQAFGPLGSLAAAFLLDQVFGNNSHKIHMYCQQVAGNYGACLPCSSFFSPCGVGGYSGGGSCSHDVCQVGGALNTSCDSCAEKVCNFDSYCCSNQWDSQCVQEAAELCNAGCSMSGLCGHDECTSGNALETSCSECASAVCNFDPYCCNNSWDAMCVQHVAEKCSGKTCANSGNCGHDECSSGGALTSDCSSCASVVCNVDPYCCSTGWDSTCVNEAAQYCNKCEGGGSGNCAHDVCEEGGTLSASCSACAGAVCDADPYCCTNAWDDQCVDQAEYYCNTSCGGGSSGTCSHDECTSGGTLTQGCSPCVDTVCGSDPYCCNTTWDSQCIQQAEQWCGLDCGGGGGGSSCLHSECASGSALGPSCSSCASAVCDADPYCCETAWDWTCVNSVADYCSISCI
jgi:hypothetical protein